MQGKNDSDKDTVQGDADKSADFESRQNLIGAFSILLEWDKRVNPQNYSLKSNQNDHA